MNWKRYSEYKDTENTLINEIPSHWSLKKLKYIASIRFSNVDKKSYEGQLDVRLCNYVDVYYNDFITDELDLMTATASEAEISKFKLRKGDVIITKDSESWDDIAVPAFVPRDYDDVICGYHLAMIRPHLDIVDGNYLFLCFMARGINDQFRIAATGVTRYGLGKYWLDNALFPVPPLEEQIKIVSYITKKLERISSLKNRVELLAGAISSTNNNSLLSEYKTSLITSAVCGKIDITNEAIR